MQNHKDKQKKYKDLDDKIYIQEAVEKRLPKERPKVIVKQTLVFKKDVKQKLEDPNKNNQEKNSYDGNDSNNKTSSTNNNQILHVKQYTQKSRKKYNLTKKCQNPCWEP